MLDTKPKPLARAKNGTQPRSSARVFLLARPKKSAKKRPWWPKAKNGRPKWAVLDVDGGWVVAGSLILDRNFEPLTEKQAVAVEKEWLAEHAGRWEFKQIEVKI